MKKMINDINDIVNEMAMGIVAAHPELTYNPKYKIIRKKEITKNKVTLLSGGGSGHEPAHAGFVGEGMIDVAVCGDVFASPSQIQVYHGIKESVSDKGTLLIIKNYTGDIMNFKNAMALAQEDGIEVDYVVVNDDIAVMDSLYTVGRRGVAGTVFVHKIAGAKAEEGAALSEVKKIAEKTISNIHSIGFALNSCTVPAKGSPIFELAENEIEYGVGIHGEPGIARKSMAQSHELAKEMIEALVRESGIKESDEVAVMINGFGASPLMELYLLNNDVTRELSEKGIYVSRTFVGNYMTSIDMAGSSVTILKLDEELKKYLSMDSFTAGFTVKNPKDNEKYVKAEATIVNQVQDLKVLDADAIIQEETFSKQNMIYLINRLADNIISKEKEFCDLDAHAGDGDFGSSIAKGFRVLQNNLAEVVAQSNSISELLEHSSYIIMEQCGGASGPIWGSAFRGAGKSVVGKETLTTVDFAMMLQDIVTAIQKTGERSFGRGAGIGDKTLMDALIPCADVWQVESAKNKTFKELFKLGAEAAVAGAEKTKEIVARMGRAGTVGERSIGYPDAGAYALGVLFTDLAERIK